MTTPPLQFGNYCACFVRDSLYKFKIHTPKEGCQEMDFVDQKLENHWCAKDFCTGTIILPEGKWEVVGRLNDLTEQQCHTMGFGPDPTSNTRWSAKENFVSQYLAAGGDPDKNPIILKR